MRVNEGIMGRRLNSTERILIKREIRPTPVRLSIYRHLRRRKGAASFGEIMEKFAKINKKKQHGQQDHLLSNAKVVRGKRSCASNR